MSQPTHLDFRHYHLAPALERYFTVLHCLDFTGPADAVVEDCLHTEWLAMRITTQGRPSEAGLHGEPLKLCAAFAASGPTSRSIRFRIKPSRMWGLGLRPLGWAAFGQGSLEALRERLFDAAAEPALAALSPLPMLAQCHGEDCDVVAARIADFLLSLKPRPVPDEERILAIQAAMGNPAIFTIADLEAATGIARRTLQRLCMRYFGFAPKRLLRRQRFMRSFARYVMLAQTWTEAIEASYHDHAHFLRDFREFTGMLPREYYAMPHPVLDRVKGQFMAEHGALPAEALPPILSGRRRLGGVVAPDSE